MRIPALALFTLAGLLPAQKLPLADHGGRQLQLFDLQRLLPPPAPNPQAPAMADGKNADLAALATFARNFVAPALGAGDDLQPLAGRWLALVGSAEQAASLERLLALAGSRHDDPIEIEVKFLRMPAKDFDAALRKQLTPVTRDATTTFEQVFAPTATEAVLRAIAAANVEELTAPRLAVTPFGRGSVSVQNRTTYVKDFAVILKDGVQIAEPILDTVWDGVVTDVIACYEPDGTIGLSCDVQWQEVQKPIPEFKTRLGLDKELTVQLPRVTGASLHQVARVHQGDLVVQATERIDGSFLVAMVAARSAPKETPIRLR